uniref:twin-arginine translocation signal domain-containing protein n=1 Tax=Stenotrophomonas maltophilia TaxID=40324 RepID=UPI0013D95D59
MDRRKFIKTSGLVTGAAAAVATPAIAQSLPKVSWRLTSSYPKSLDTLYGLSTHLAKRVAEMTDNQFQIQP